MKLCTLTSKIYDYFYLKIATYLPNLIEFGYLPFNLKLSEDFIIKFQDKIDWITVSRYQKLSEDFIRKFQDKVNWDYISTYQKLSEDFIREFVFQVNWYNISEYQKLSEDFIREFQYFVNLDNISNNQKLSDDFIKEFGLYISPNNMYYWTREKKLAKLKEKNNYEIINDEYIIAYKAIKCNRYSHFNFQYQYLKGNTYESHCDPNNDEENSFGLSAWTYKGAKGYNNSGVIVRVKIHIDNLLAIVHNSEKLRCDKLIILD